KRTRHTTIDAPPSMSRSAPRESIGVDGAALGGDGGEAFEGIPLGGAARGVMALDMSSFRRNQGRSEGGVDTSSQTIIGRNAKGGMMFKNLGLVVVAAFACGASFGAKFSNLKHLTSSQLETLASKAEEIQKNRDLFGDCSSVKRYHFDRKPAEQDINTTKQL